MTRFLALDVGERRIGIAFADTATGAVKPLATIRRADAERDAASLARLAAEQVATELVIGLPLNADGSAGNQALRTREWAAAVTEIAPLALMPKLWRDERHTSERAEAIAGRQGRGRAGGPPSPAARNSYRARIDRLAAAAIAQAELDARNAR